MDDLINIIDAERECIDCLKKAIKLEDFYNSPYFHVFYRNGDLKSKHVSPNAATSIIGRVVRNCGSLVQEYLSEKDKGSWNNLVASVDAARKHLSEEDLSQVLPLKTMGILPLFSTCYLAEFLDDLENPLKSSAYAIAIRRILFAIYHEMRTQRETSDKMHPFLLYRCIKTLTKFNQILSLMNSKSENIDFFISNIKNDTLIQNAVEKRFESCVTEYDMNIVNAVYGINSTDFKGEFLNNIFVSDKRVEKINKLINHLEERASIEALKQISSRTKVPQPELDSSALAFSLGVLSVTNNKQHTRIISEGLNIIFKNCDEGVWHTMMPFYTDNKGRAIFVPSIEIAVISLIIFLKQFKKKLETPDIEDALLVTGKVQQRLFEKSNIVKIDDEKKEVIVEGWCTDKAPSYNRVDSWINAHSLSFLLRRLDLVQFAKKRKTMDEYDWTSHEDCRPKWDEIVDPEISPSTEGVKGIIQKALEADILDRKKSPMFLLYGPPGTGKTALVGGIANKLGWDLMRLSPSDFVAEGPARIELHSRNIFNNLMKEDLDKCIILMDEMDSLFRYRERLPIGSMIEFIVPAFLPKLQRLREHVLKKKMAVFIITNFFESIDRSISRGGRIDYKLLVLPFNRNAKFEVLKRFLEKRLKGENRWFNNGALTDAGNKAMTKILDACSPFLVYRELEQLSHQIASNCPDDPMKVKPKEISIPPLISPETYQDRYGAYPEICALVYNRIFDRNGVRDLTAISKEEAKTLLQQEPKGKAKRLEWNQWKKLFTKVTEAISKD